MRKVLFSGLTILAGGIAGAVMTVFLSHSKAATPPPALQAVIESEAEAPKGTAGPRATPDVELRRLKQRLAALEQRDEAAAESAEAKPPPDEKESKAQHERAHKDLLDAHRREGVDEAWAPGAQASIGGELRAMGEKNGYSVQSVECRTKSCVATLEWGDFTRASQGWSGALHHMYKENCAREILLTEPDEPGAPYQASMVFECER